MLSVKTFFVFATSFLAFFSVDYASADGNTGQEHLSNVLGKYYEFESSDGKLETLLKAFKVSDDDIKKAQASHARIMLTFDNGKYTLKGSIKDIGERSKSFKIGEEFSMKILQKVFKVTFTQEKNVLKQVIKWEDVPTATCTYTFTPDKLTLNIHIGEMDPILTFVPKQ